MRNMYEEFTLMWTTPTIFYSGILHKGNNLTDKSKRILFVDEALPRGFFHAQNGYQFNPNDTLRFVRNVGRVRGWRVFVA